ncbi:methyltransferase-like protein 25B isoform X2 [Bicyclus anynana]|uniref:Methyltransferase-like protein 25B isoform X2 n=1 Tax=Bicyclus anynana TaxID=110368 RepID=A0A6J1NGE9_BICAN|nr:methyltransferase-like protein 25B isoform X2 [Bicyclus anynana]
MLSQVNTIKTAIEMCLKVIKTYEWLLDLYVLDFFVNNHWKKLPASWQQSLENLDPKDLGDILSGNPTIHLLPLSLLALFKTITSLSIPRGNIDCTKTNVAEEKYGCGHPKLKNLFIKHVKLKKRHEMTKMAEFVSMTARESNCRAVLDFGSGLGHLIRILSYKYNLHSVGIEMQTQLTVEARKLDLELEYTVKKYLTEEQMCNLVRPTHCNLTLSSMDQLQHLTLPVSVINYGLVGLHPCGDLGPLLIKHFVNSERVHAFRAALEKLLVQRDPTLRHMPVRSVKHSNNMTFHSYCDAALKQICVQPLDYDSVCCELQQWKKVVMLYTLRLALAPLVETVVLLDRLLYLLENNIPCAIYPVFDPRISPRNHIIVGRKL